MKGRIIRCVLFDLGDTLWYRKDPETWRRLEFAANCQAIALLRTHLESCSLPDQDDVTLGRSLRVAFDAQTRARIRRDPSHEPDGAEVAMETLAQLGWGQIDRQLGAALFEALRVRIIDSRLLYDDALPTLAELRRRGFLLGVVTNRLWGGPPFQEDLRAFGLFEYFDPATIAISADLGVRKPDPAIFLHTLRALNVSPAEAAMVGDSLRSDIVGAKRLGLLAIWKPKPRVREALQARLVAPGAASAGAAFEHQGPCASSSSAGGVAGDLPPDLPPGLHVTDDDYVLSTVQGPGSDPLALLASDAEEYKPDLMIEQLSDLLEIFPKAGAL